MVDKRIEDGKRLIEALDRTDLVVDSALWFYFDEPGEWRLVIGTPYVEKRGPKEAYAVIGKVIAAMEGMFSIELSQVMAVSTHHPIVSALRSFFITRKDAIVVNQISKMVLDGVYFEDAFFYRSSPSGGHAERRGVVVS